MVERTDDRRPRANGRSPGRRWRRRLAALVVALVVGSVSTVLPAQPAAAVGSRLDSTPDDIWGVTNRDTTSRHTRQIRSLVRDMQEYRGHMYVAGTFLDVIAPDGSTTRQSYLARFDLDSGVWDASWRPDVDGIVYAIDIHPDGRLYVGGEFDGGVAKYDARTGVRDTDYRPGLVNSWGPPAVYDLEVNRGHLFVVGVFSSAQDVALSNVARFHPFSGDVDPNWRPAADRDEVAPEATGAGSLVYDIEFDDDRDRIFLAGKFGGIDGDTDAAYFATLRRNGTLDPAVPQGLPPGIPSHRDAQSMWMEAIVYDSAEGLVHVGGSGHVTLTLDAGDLALRSVYFTHRGVGDLSNGGDTQVLHLGADTLWAGCHCWGSVGPFEIGSYIDGADGVMVDAEYQEWREDFATIDPFGQQAVRGAYGLDRDDQSLDPIAFDLSGQAGPHAIVEDSNGRLWLGGQFDTVRSTGRAVHGIARFSPMPVVDTPPPAVDPIDPPPEGARPADDEIVRLYRAAFGRAPDADGLAHWAGRYRTGTPLRTIADAFVGSDEYEARYGADPTSEEFVDQLYRNVLGRAGDDAGRRFWLGRLDQGLADRAGVLISFANSPENIDRTGTTPPIDVVEGRILRLYRAAFGRQPDPAGYASWIAAHRNGMSLTEIARAFTASPEWRDRYGADPAADELVEGLYRNVLGRAPDPAGAAYWTDRMAAVGAEGVLVGLSESAENRERTGTR